MQIQYRIRCEFPEQRLGEELMIFDHEADKVHVLNGTSAVVWHCLSRGGDLEEAARDLCTAYRVGEGQNVLSMVQAAVEQLNERGLLSAQMQTES